MTKTKLNLRKTGRIPLEITVGDSITTFSLLPKFGKVLDMKKQFAKEGLFLATAEQVANLLSASRQNYDSGTNSSIARTIIGNSANEGIVTSTYILSSKLGFYVCQDRELDYFPTGDELEERCKSKPNETVFVKSPIRNSDGTEVRDLDGGFCCLNDERHPFWEVIFGKNYNLFKGSREHGDYLFTNWVLPKFSGFVTISFPLREPVNNCPELQIFSLNASNRGYGYGAFSFPNVNLRERVNSERIGEYEKEIKRYITDKKKEGVYSGRFS